MSCIDFVMSAEAPKMFQLVDVDLLSGLGEFVFPPQDLDAPPRLRFSCAEWHDEVCRSLGFTRVEHYPIHWDGSGIFILERVDAAKVDPNLPARKYQFLSIMDVQYESGINVGIPDVAALMQFYCLVQPMLMLKTARQFTWSNEDNGLWDQGKSLRDMHARDLAAYEKRKREKLQTAKVGETNATSST